MSSRPRIWLTRPRADSEVLAAHLAAHGIDSLIAPLMRIQPHSAPTETVSERPDALLLTSRHAAHALIALPAGWHALPVFCVGNATATAAHEAGFMHTVHGEEDILALLPRIPHHLGEDARILYLAGDETRVDVATLLAAQNIAVEKITAYHAIAETELPANAIEALNTSALTGVSLFSPRSARIATELLNHHACTHRAAQMEAYCLSLAVAEAAATLPWRSVHACHRPTTHAMVDLIVSRCASTVL